jgi:hypothetical protein
VLTVTKLWVRSFSIDFLDVFWEISTVRGPSTDSDLKSHEIYNYDFFVLRSEAAMGPYAVMGGPFRDLYRFRDNRVPALHKWRQFFYKLRIVDRRTNETAEVGPTASSEAAPDILASAIIREEDQLFREFVGRRSWLFPARTFGPRCSCYDATLNRIARSNHLPCFGTGWLGGYLSPVEIFIQFDPNPKQVALQAMGETQPSNTAARCSSFPPVSPRDILIESENRRWRVVNVVPTQRLRAVVHQELQLHEVPRSDIEYSIPLNIDAQGLVPASERNFRNAQNIDSPDADYKDILSFFGHPQGTLR